MTLSSFQKATGITNLNKNYLDVAQQQMFYAGLPMYYLLVELHFTSLIMILSGKWKTRYFTKILSQFLWKKLSKIMYSFIFPDATCSITFSIYPYIIYIEIENSSLPLAWFYANLCIVPIEKITLLENHEILKISQTS